MTPPTPAVPPPAPAPAPAPADAALAHRKRCTLCAAPRDVLVRCQLDETRAWHFVCAGACWRRASGGAVDGDAQHRWYRYGGMWKNKHAGVSARMKGGRGWRGRGGEGKTEREGEREEERGEGAVEGEGGLPDGEGEGEEKGKGKGGAPAVEGESG